jgi:16S rRNA C967 or C1407 C5-methylase (RsmB/RsmF family)
MGNEGEMVTLDMDNRRLGFLRENVERLGINIIKIVKADATADLRMLVPLTGFLLMPLAQVLVC